MKLEARKGEMLTLTLSNTKGEKVSLTYDEAKGTVAMDRKASVNTSFSELFPAVTKAPIHGGSLVELRLFVDNSSIEAFCNDGRTVMTNTVFPSEPYNALTITGKKGSKVKASNIYGIF